jgi:uncharacterized protein (TIGR03086 family)
MWMIGRMDPVADLLIPYHRALGDADAHVAMVDRDRWAAPTPCERWDVAALVTHMIGQNHGFARAVASGDAPASAYLVAMPGVDDAPARWRRSAAQLRQAFADAKGGSLVRLVEIDPRAPVTVERALRMQLLDTVVHTWDLASALGVYYRPDPELVEIVAGIADRVPSGAARTKPGAAFAPTRSPDTDDLWLTALALLGRDARAPLPARVETP